MMCTHSRSYKIGYRQMLQLNSTCMCIVVQQHSSLCKHAQCVHLQLIQVQHIKKLLAW